MCDPGTVIMLLICTALACAVAIAAIRRGERKESEADEIVADVEEKYERVKAIGRDKDTRYEALEHSFDRVCKENDRLLAKLEAIRNVVTKDNEQGT